MTYAQALHLVLVRAEAIMDERLWHKPYRLGRHGDRRFRGAVRVLEAAGCTVFEDASVAVPRDVPWWSRPALEGGL